MPSPEKRSQSASSRVRQQGFSMTGPAAKPEKRKLRAIEIVGLIALAYGPGWLAVHLLGASWPVLIAAVLWPFALVAVVARRLSRRF